MRRFLLKGQIRALEQLPSGRFIAGADGRIVELDTATGQTRAFIASRGMVRSLAVLPDGRVVSGSSDARLGIWNIADGTCTELRKGLRRPIYAIACHSSGRLLTGGASALLVWNLDAGTNVELSGHAGEIRTITLLPDGRVVRIGGRDRVSGPWRLARATASAVIWPHQRRRTGNGCIISSHGQEVALGPCRLEQLCCR
jgi:WD40 repeat protein